MADNVASILNDLIETSKDGEKGFNTAADDTKNPELKTTFRRRAQDCARSAADLQGLVARLGESLKWAAAWPAPSIAVG
jgi:uncharacterized protein (TIGR02284 family)